MAVKKAKVVVLCLAESLFRCLTAGGRGDGGNRTRLWVSCSWSQWTAYVEVKDFGSDWPIKSFFIRNNQKNGLICNTWHYWSSWSQKKRIVGPLSIGWE